MIRAETLRERLADGEIDGATCDTICTVAPGNNAVPALQLLGNGEIPITGTAAIMCMSSLKDEKKIPGTR